MPTFSHVV